MNINLFLEKIDQLKNDPATDSVALAAIEQWILNSKPIERRRINPFAIVQASGLGLGVIVPQLLRAVKSGLFDLHWDIHCPHCDMVAGQHDDLTNATAVYFCHMCERDFEADFSERVEVTFALNKAIEDLELPPICPPPPSIRPRFEMTVPNNQTGSAEDVLGEGVYKYNCPITQSTGTLTVSGPETDEVQVLRLKQLENERFDHSHLHARPGKIRFELTNVGYPITGLWVAEQDLPLLAVDELPVRLSGLDVIHYPEFKALFGNQVLSERERIKIASVTTLFTDITGSTQMYEKLGDAVAYNLVRDHFDILFETIEGCGGTVLKTIGDAVMASFTGNDRALRSIVTAMHRIKAYNQNRHIDEQINIKVGLHRGPSILVNLNGKLDYFGSTINKAARIQSLSGSREITFSEEVYADEAFRNVMQEMNLFNLKARRVNLRGLEGEHTLYSLAV